MRRSLTKCDVQSPIVSSTLARFGIAAWASVIAAEIPSAMAAERIRVRIGGDIQQWMVVGDQNISAEGGSERATWTPRRGAIFCRRDGLF